MDAVTALPGLARGMLDGITCCIGLTVGKGPPFVYLPSWVPTATMAADVDSTPQIEMDKMDTYDTVTGSVGVAAVVDMVTTSTRGGDIVN